MTKAGRLLSHYESVTAPPDVYATLNSIEDKIRTSASMYNIQACLPCYNAMKEEMENDGFGVNVVNDDAEGRCEVGDCERAARVELSIAPVVTH